MKKIIFFIPLICFASGLLAQTQPANYATALSKFVQLYNTNKVDSIFNMFSKEMKTSLPLESFRTTTMQLRAQLGNLTRADFVKYESPVASYKANFEKGVFSLNLALNGDGQFTGLFLKPYTAEAAVTAVTPTSTIATDPSITESPIILKTLEGTLAGTLAMPKNAGEKVPVVLIIAGSGPTDRDGNSPKLGLFANDYKLIANELGKNGIASVRYDKRLVGQSVSTTKENELRFEDYVDDALGLINLLVADERFSKVIVLGHSEGSLVGMMACIDQPVKAFISVAGAGDSADKIMVEQMKSQSKFVSDGFNRMLDSLKKGKTTDNIDPLLYAVARPSIQKYLMSWFRYNPTREIRKLNVPILILQGTTDLQVTVADANKLKKAKSEAILDIIPGMNHVLKEAPADREKNLATYNQPDLPLKPEFVKALIGFVKKVK
ncbi:Lysophospholipase, alpha-beta hydrolase superfamily [Mucilaginibacter pineti]|uniref:Lysophospholipase, alpha-beta hydrolase superfamily n=1 Tax=Mucilaginibacter pineti TaxID=1391627 RepID=A0A1G6W327_9SPHI|nr:alpha/beta fold hydrolase [Mucilaginibacter pineti]SDD60204.1 Lysophospholipase, alpha-beta hydrolase superfamily [Mucilaginibacter pineti]